MTLDQIRALPVIELAGDTCALILWITDPLLAHAVGIIEAWGFTYKTVAFTWVKSTKDGTGFPIGCGYYTRANPEQCLLATRGKPQRLSCSVPQLIVAPRREHRRKPDEVYERIEALFPGPYIELFARTRRPGWHVAFSNEADSGPATRRWSCRGYPSEDTYQSGGAGS
jgi:N6-adenosine-specific RNA methylase IME4